MSYSCGLMRWFAAWSLCACAAAHAQVTIESPVGGWKHSGGEPAQHVQDVNYPASRVNAGARRQDESGRDLGAAIRGRVANAPKGKGEPHLLVVNGIALPLSAGEDGGFARPYSFPPGSNSVEIKSPDRKSVRRVNYFDSNAARQRVGLRIVLSWDSDMTDLDLHVVSPDGQHVFYGNRVGKNGGALDVDVTGGYGPEIYAIPSPPKGNWLVYVNYFGGGMGEGSYEQDSANAAGEKVITIAQVAVVSNEGTPDERRQVFRVPMRRAGDLTLVKSFVYP